MENLGWEKIFSGKFVFTVITALVFGYAVHARILNGEQVYGVIMLVVAFYFNKNQNQPQGDTNETSNLSNPVVPVNPDASKS